MCVEKTVYSVRGLERYLHGVGTESKGSQAVFHFEAGGSAEEHVRIWNELGHVQSPFRQGAQEQESRSLARGGLDGAENSPTGKAPERGELDEQDARRCCHI